MDDKVLFPQSTVEHFENFVVRQFSPARIERLLLTRLFDLTAGHAVADSWEGAGTCSVPKAAATDGGKEAA